MRITLRHLLILFAFGGALLMAFGCSQHDDIMQPQNHASITLRPHNLPSLDTIYAYEMWTLSVDGSDSTFTSLGKFCWDVYNFRMTDLTGNPIDSVYDIPGVWQDHDYIVVTVENRNDLSPEPSGVIMLIDEVVDPSTRPIRLHFPGDFSLTTGFYFVATPSDDNDYFDEEKGIWICSRAISPRRLQDTLGILNTILTPTQQADDETRSKYDVDIIGVVEYTVLDSVMVVIGYDTIRDHTRIEVVWKDTVDTNSDYVLTVNYDTAQSVDIEYYNYAGPIQELPDIEPYGWRYNAWVFHEYFPTDAGLPVIVPFGFERQELFIADSNWRVLPLGAFADPNFPDFSNPYTNNLEVPQFPGEDFLVDAGALNKIDLRYDGNDLTGGEWGSVAIGMEPIPNPGKISVDTARNFPLFVLSDFLRSASHTIINPNDTTQHLSDVDWVHTFHNWNQFLPEIRLAVEFHE
jgi:hypothetical protein